MDSPAARTHRAPRADAIRALSGRRAGVPRPGACRGVGAAGAVAVGGAPTGADRAGEPGAHQGRGAGRQDRQVAAGASAGSRLRVPRAAGPSRDHRHRCCIAGSRHGRLHLFLLAGPRRHSGAAPGSPVSGFAGRCRHAAVVSGFRAHPRAGRHRRSGDGVPRAHTVQRCRRRRARCRARLRPPGLARVLRGTRRRALRRSPPCPRDRAGGLGAGSGRQRTVLEAPARCRSACRWEHAAGERAERDARRHSRGGIQGCLPREPGGDLRTGNRRRRARAGAGGGRSVG